MISGARLGKVRNCQRCTFYKIKFKKFKLRIPRSLHLSSRPVKVILYISTCTTSHVWNLAVMYLTGVEMAQFNWASPQQSTATCSTQYDLQNIYVSLYCYPTAILPYQCHYSYSFLCGLFSASRNISVRVRAQIGRRSRRQHTFSILFPKRGASTLWRTFSFSVADDRPDARLFKSEGSAAYYSHTHTHLSSSLENVAVDRKASYIDNAEALVSERSRRSVHRTSTFPGASRE